jgi:hypothetical protein
MTNDYEDMWYNLYEHVLSHNEKHVVAIMQEMDPSLRPEDDEWVEPGLRHDQTLEIEVMNIPPKLEILQEGDPCPNCGEKQYRVEHQGTTRTIWICDECGYEQTYH